MRHILTTKTSKPARAKTSCSRTPPYSTTASAGSGTEAFTHLAKKTRHFGLDVHLARDKGFAPTFRFKKAWRRPLGENPDLQKLLRRLRRQAILMAVTGGGAWEAHQDDEPARARQDEIIILEGKITRACHRTFDLAYDGLPLRWIKRASDDQDLRRRKAKLRALEQWRHRLATCFGKACRWMRNSSDQTIDYLDDNQGTKHVSPGAIAEEAHRRCLEKFTTPASTELLGRWHTLCGHMIPCTPMELKPLTGKRLRAKVQLLKATAAVGTDGWTRQELLALPLIFWTRLAALLTRIEICGFWPEPLMSIHHFALKKPAKPQCVPQCQIRLLLVEPIIVRTWASIRAQEVNEWQLSWLPEQLHGGLPGRSTATALAALKIAVMEAKEAGHTLSAVLLDAVECFDRVDPDLAMGILRHCGCNEFVLRGMRAKYQQETRLVLCNGEPASTETFRAIVGLIQGCALSVCAINAINACWVYLCLHDACSACLRTGSPGHQLLP